MVRKLETLLNSEKCYQYKQLFREQDKKKSVIHKTTGNYDLSP